MAQCLVGPSMSGFSPFWGSESDESNVHGALESGQTNKITSDTESKFRSTWWHHVVMKPLRAKSKPRRTLYFLTVSIDIGFVWQDKAKSTSRSMHHGCHHAWSTESGAKVGDYRKASLCRPCTVHLCLTQKLHKTTETPNWITRTET